MPTKEAQRNAHREYTQLLRLSERVMLQQALQTLSPRDRRVVYLSFYVGLTQAEIAVRRARLDLERTRIRAPFPGRVASLGGTVAKTHLLQGRPSDVMVDVARTIGALAGEARTLNRIRIRQPTLEVHVRNRSEETSPLSRLGPDDQRETMQLRRHRL